MIRRTLLLILTLCGALRGMAEPPRLVVQIVVGSMRAEDLDRYAVHFGTGGLAKLAREGTVYAGCRYDCLQTTTPVSLATLTTGAMPSTHGVVGSRWIDPTTNRPVELTQSSEGPSPHRLIAPTLAQALRRHSPRSRTVTVAAEAASAVVLAGRGGQAFWLEPERCDWATSPAYAPELDEWIAASNRNRYTLSYLTPEWHTLLERDRYLNTRCYDIVSVGKHSRGQAGDGTLRLKLRNDYDRLRYTPAGNAAVLDMAKQVIARYGLGDDDAPDLLNICLDASRRIAEAYGPESVEVEDMYCRLDRDLADFLTFAEAQVEGGGLVVVLTSDHGTSPSCDTGAEPVERFRPRQFEVIVNGFLNVRYGAGEWVTAYAERNLWLNHSLIYERGLDLAAVQNEVAGFALQFGGVSHALAATAMRTSYFGSGYARRMQNSFYPRRSGDVVVNLMPGWIEEHDRCRSMSGSMYGYDTDVPLIFYGKGIGARRIGRPVEATSVAPTLARLLGVRTPAAAEGPVLEEIAER